MRKKLYRCTSTFSALNCCCGIFFKSLQLSIRSGAHIFSADFWTFRNFYRDFAKIMAPPSDNGKNYLAILKVQSFLKKKMKTESKWSHKLRQNSCLKHISLERTALQTRSLTNKRKTDKHHIFTPIAGARRSISPKLCMVVELVVPILPLGSKILIFGHWVNLNTGWRRFAASCR